MTIEVPVWLLWLCGGGAAVVVLALAVVGALMLDFVRRGVWG